MSANAHSAERMRERTWTITPQGWTKMARTTIEEKALRLLSAFERAGRTVGRVTVDGRKIELVLLSDQPTDEFERLDMRYGKT